MVRSRHNPDPDRQLKLTEDFITPPQRDAVAEPEPAVLVDAAAASVRVAELRERLEQYSELYYQESESAVSDEVFDALMRELQTLEETWPQLASPDSPTQKIGGAIARGFRTVRHQAPVLSLQDVFSRTEVDEFVNRMQASDPAATLIVEPKIDGLSVILRYLNGRLALALTRGDGIEGEDITENARELIDLPQVLEPAPEMLEVRGEVYLPVAEFDRINAEQEELGARVFANPRNCAAGTMRQLDPAIVAARRLRTFIFQVRASSEPFGPDDSDALLWLAGLGFATVPDVRVCRNADEVWAAIEAIGEQRFALPFGIDGAVINLNVLEARARHGQTSKAPRWAVAFKYPPEQRETRLQDIRVQVGRTGRLTPMAWLEPVRIAGSTVSRATLHNQDYIDMLDVRVNDVVVVQKAGDIIPAIVAVRHDLREGDPPRFVLPEHCPVCGARTAREEDGSDLRCTGADCPAQLSRHLIYFASKDAMDIEGMGPATVLALMDAGWLRSISDVYMLPKRREELTELNLIGRQKTVDRLVAAIERSKDNSLDRLITGLGIRNIARQAARVLATHFSDMDALMAADETELISLPDFGQISAQSITQFFADEQNRALIERLRAAGLNFQGLPAAINLPLTGKVFVLTGTLPSLTRDEATERILAAGGKVSGSVSRKTDYVIAGAEAGSKLAKAEALQVPILDEAGLLRLLEDR